MKNFLTKLALLALAATAGFFGWENHRLRGDVRKLRDTVQLLERERTPVAPAPVLDTGDRARALAEIEKQTSALRELPFQKPVQYKTIGREELREYLRKKLHEQYTPAELHDYGRTLETIGLIPGGTDLLAVVLGMYDEQVAAFYVPEERALYTFKDGGLASNLEKVTMAHELTHALQDQNFDLLKLPLRIKDNDDLALASSALVEGDATLLMGQYYGEHLDARNLLADVLGAVLGQRTAQFQSAPAYFREMMLFPYQEGAAFATAIFAAGGWEALNAAYRNPPQSTEEILHPEKFIGQRERPVRLELPAPPRAGWRKIGENTLGEFGLRSLFSQHHSVFEAVRAAQGWQGDRYQVYESSATGPVVLVWDSAWDTAADAEEFAASYRRLAQKRGVVFDIQVTGPRVAIRQASDAATLELWK